MNPKITFIVPIYNTQNELIRCLDSIMYQTYKNWNCILVDDGSTDHSGEICDGYRNKDDRFLVFHRSNEGVNSTRNFGLSHADGDYIAFVDSDDWIESNYLEFLISNMSDDVDMVMCHAIFEYSNLSMEVLKIKPDTIVCSEKNKSDYILASISKGYAKNVLFEEHGFLNTVWGKIYRNDTIKKNNLAFAQLPLNEDAVFNLYFFYYAKGFKIYNHILYHYRMRELSAVHSFKQMYIVIYDTYLNEVKKFIEKYYKNEDIFKKTYESLTATCLFNITKDYFYNPHYLNKAERKNEMISLIRREPYREAVRRFNRSLSKNREVTAVLYAYKLRVLWLLDWYFSFRPSLKAFVLSLGKCRDKF